MSKLQDMLNIAREYAAKMATGEVSINEVKDLKPVLKNKIMDILRNNTKIQKLVVLLEKLLIITRNISLEI